MKILLNIFLFLLLSVVSVISQETGSIKGVVKDLVTGESIPFATIMVENSKLGTYANTSGFFFLKGIPSGKQTISANAIGYTKSVISMDIKPNESQSITLKINPIPIELQGVTRVSERIKEAYKNEISVQALSQQEIKIIPATSEKDIFRLMQVLPGVSSTGDVTSQFYVRGGSGDQNLILYDHMMIYSPFHAFGLFSIFNTDIIKVSEMMTGGFSPEYGGRLSSVMNIISKDGNSNYYTGKLNIGSSSTQGMIEGPVLGGSIITSVRKSYFSNVFKKFLGKDIPLDFYDVNSKLTFPISNEGKFSFSALTSNDNVDRNEISSPNYLWKNGAFGANVQMSIEDYYVDVAVSFSYSKSLVDYKNYNGKTNTESEISNIYFDAKAESYIFDKDVMSYGFSFILPRTQYKFNNSSGYPVNNQLDQQESGFWFKYRFSEIDKFSADFGFRSNFEYLTENISYAFEPRIKLSYQPFQSVTLKASANRYHQNMITTANEDDIIPLFETWLPVQKPYFPERCDEYIGALETELSNNISFSFQGYFKLYTNLLGYNLKKNDESDPDFSAGTGRSYGYEFFLKYQDETFYGWLNYTLSWAKRKSDRIKFVPKYDRRHIINILGNAKLPYELQFNLKWELASGTMFSPVLGYFDRINYDTFLYPDYLSNNGSSYGGYLGSKNSDRLPWYHRLDIGFSRVITFWHDMMINLKLDFTNVYDRKNIFYIDRDTGEKVNMLPFMVSFFVGIEI
jgi:hypothetical protein